MTSTVRRTFVVATCIAALVGVLASGCATSSATKPVAASSPVGTDASPVASGSSVTSSPGGPTEVSSSPTVDPGTLPQTHALPSPDDPAFQAGVQLMWKAIVEDDPSAALPFFFPETAYVQVKALKNATTDYQERLIHFYGLDIHALHAMLGPDAADAQFVSISVPTAKAEWILPGVETNKESYYRVYGSRITYTENGKTKSFGVFSLISWRGEWYVVHLGPNPRPKDAGVVYAPIG
jgi:hypothetical protein